MTPPRSSNSDGWWPVPAIVVTQEGGRRFREQAVAAQATVLDFSATRFASMAALDELVGKGDWEATTGESAELREKVETVLRRRGRLP